MQNCIHFTKQPHFVGSNRDQETTQDVPMSCQLICILSTTRDAKETEGSRA